MTNLEYGVYFGGEDGEWTIGTAIDTKQFLTNIKSDSLIVSDPEQLGTIECMAVCKDEIYTAGYKPNAADNTQFDRVLLKYNKNDKKFGVKNMLPESNDAQYAGLIRVMLSYKDKLYIGGQNQSDLANAIQYLCVYDPANGTFTDMSDKTGVAAPSTTGGQIGIASMIIFNDNLYIGGDYQNEDGGGNNGNQDLFIAKLDADGSKFTQLTTNFEDTPAVGVCRTMVLNGTTGIMFGGDLFTATPNTHQYGKISDKDVVEVINTTTDGHIYGSTVYKNEIYFCGYEGNSAIDFGNPEAPTHYLVKYNSDDSLTQINTNDETNWNGALYGMSAFQSDSNQETMHLGGLTFGAGGDLLTGYIQYVGAYDGTKVTQNVLFEKAGTIQSVFTYAASDDDSSNLGLILGLTLGIALPIVLIALYFLYFKFII